MAEWLIVLLIVVGLILILFALSIIFYKQFFKRFWDIFLSGLAIIVLSPLFIILTVVGAIAIKGNPFFTQLRPGWHEKIFKLIKFRTMDNRKDENGNLLPDEVRLNKYGRFLRATSLDELPELFNIFIGNMSVIGPRPLLVEYLPWYNEQEKHRHDVRPGLTGWAQVNGRNNLDWEKRFSYDVYYVDNVTLFMDIKIIIITVFNVLKRSDVAENTRQSEGNFAQIRKSQQTQINN